MAKSENEIPAGVEGASVLGPQVEHVEIKPSPDDALIMNTRGGVYQAHAAHQNKALSNPRQARLEIATMSLMPGLNFTSSALWDKLQDQPGPRERIADGVLVQVKDFAAISPRLAMEYVRKSGNVATLERLLADERRDLVADAIRKQLAACAEGPAPQSARLREVHAGAR